MKRKITGNLTGKTYGQLTVIGYAGRRRTDNRVCWRCRCSCGNVIVVLGKCLENGDTNSCRLFANHAEHLPDGTTVIYLHHKGEVVKCFVDTADYPSVKNYRWCVNRGNHLPYVSNNIGFMHTLLLPDAEEVDHKNHNGLDNRRANLRPASSGQNKANQRKQVGTSSKYKGVYWSKQNGRFGPGRGWIASIKVNGKTIRLGGYANEETAALAYDLAAINYFGEFAHLNILSNPHARKAAA